MNTPAPVRGGELVAGGRAIGIGPQWLARLWSGGIHRILDRIDAGLHSGSLLGTLPDGSTRLMGGRAPGFAAQATLHHPRGLWRLATGGSIGLYQAWEAGEWSSPDPVEMFALFVANAAALGDTARARGPWRLLGRMVHWLHRNTRSGSERNIHLHYDLGNDFYGAWLDPTMSYSSALFAKGETDLEEGQKRKIAQLAQRLNGADTVLDIGCGWGALARQLADGGAHVTAISLSYEQLAWARQTHGMAAIDFRKQDYRDVSGQFSGIVSAEMVEAVGREYWPEFFAAIARCLKPGGRAAIQFISMRDDLFDAYARSADFIQAYVFPGGMLVRESEFRRLAEDCCLTWQDREGFAADYAETLRQWRLRFERAVEEGRLPTGFDAQFVRFWRYYLMYCEGGFRGRGIDVAQVTLAKAG